LDLNSVVNFKALLEAAPGLKAHLDFGHIQMGRDDHDAFCRQLAAEIAHVHFSDNRGREDNHMPLGVGSIDWHAAVKLLKAIGYDETITLEVFCDDTAMFYKYLDLSRKLVLDLWQG